MSRRNKLDEKRRGSAKTRGVPADTTAPSKPGPRGRATQAQRISNNEPGACYPTKFHSPGGPKTVPSVMNAPTDLPVPDHEARMRTRKADVLRKLVTYGERMRRCLPNDNDSQYFASQWLAALDDARVLEMLPPNC